MADLAPSNGEELLTKSKQWPKGSAAGRRLFGRRFEPRSGAHAGGAAHGKWLARFQTTDQKNCNWLRYHSTVRCYGRNVHPNCLELFDYTLFYHALGYAMRMTPKRGGIRGPRLRLI